MDCEFIMLSLCIVTVKSHSFCQLKVRMGMWQTYTKITGSLDCVHEQCCETARKYSTLVERICVILANLKI